MASFTLILLLGPYLELVGASSWPCAQGSLHEKAQVTICGARDGI